MRNKNFNVLQNIKEITDNNYIYNKIKKININNNILEQIKEISELYKEIKPKKSDNNKKKRNKK